MGGDSERADGAGAPGERSPAPRADADEAEDGPIGGFFSKIFGILQRPSGDAAPASEPGANAERPKARREMIERVVGFDDKRVEDVMSPRADIVAVELETPLAALIRAFAEAGHSRLPIYRGDLDDPVGMVHIKDVVAAIAEPARADAASGPILERIRRDLLYVPPSMRATDLLLKMQASRIHMALVIDEFGGTDGLVTIEDLVEEIVGEIEDEHDDEEKPTITARQGGGWDADARVELEEFARATGCVIPVDEEEIDTLGGVVFALAGRVPARGEIVAHAEAGLDFEIIEADARKIRRLRIRPRSNPAPEPAI